MYSVLVRGNIHKFLLKCNINLINIKYISSKEFIIIIHKEDYKKLFKIYGFKYKLINKFGYDRIIDLLKKYKVFIISFLLGIFLLIMLSNIIFNININLDNKELNNTIRKELENYGIEKYKFKKSYKENNRIKQIIKEKYKDNIEWLEITNSGTTVNINIIERKIDKPNISDNLYSIVAKKSGFIKKIDVIDGIKVINENNYVNKGDIIISSNIYLNDELKGRVSANGNVFASVWYKVICEYPLEYEEKLYTHKKRKTIFFKIGNRTIELFKYKNYEKKEIYSIKDNLTNISVGIEEIEKVDIITKKYNNKEAIKKAEIKSKEVIKNRLGKDEYIISQKTLKFNSNGSKIILEMFFSVYEEISEKRVIEGSDING